jgi:hypothetical protein
MFAESLILLAAASAAAQSQAAPRAGKPIASLYEAVVATEQTPAAKDLTKPAVFIMDGGRSAIIGQAGAGPIA